MRPKPLDAARRERKGEEIWRAGPGERSVINTCFSRNSSVTKPLQARVLLLQLLRPLRLLQLQPVVLRTPAIVRLHRDRRVVASANGMASPGMARGTVWG